MKGTRTTLPEVLMLAPVRHADSRGYFLETFRLEPYREAGVDVRFVQDNLSRSSNHVLRGLHYQRRQGKLVTVVSGAVFDVAVDIRPDSERFGEWMGVRLDDTNHRQLFLPPGFAHGFCVISESADVWYKTTDIYRPEEEGGISWDDPAIGIEWPIERPILSDKDRQNPRLADVPRERLITAAEIAQLESESG